MTWGRQVILREFNQPLEVRKFEIAKPGADGVLVRVDAAGVCGSDLHTWRGEVPRRLPIVLGHEGIGTIDTLGDNVATDSAGTALRPGDRIYWVTMRACHRCRACVVERDPSACENKVAYGPVGSGNWNSYADYATLPPGIGFFRIPEDTPSEAVIAFGCAMPTMLQAIERVGHIRRGTSVVVQGCGPVGLAAVLIAQSSGAYPIVAVDRFKSRLDMALSIGASHVVSLQEQSDTGPVEEVRNLCGGRGAELVIEATGALAAFGQGLAYVAHGGRYLLVGLWAGSGTVALDPHYVLRNNIKIIGSAYAATAHCHQAVGIAQRNHRHLPLSRVVTNRFGLDHAMDAFETIRRGAAGKAILVPGLN